MKSEKAFMKMISRIILTVYFCFISQALIAEVVKRTVIGLYQRDNGIPLVDQPIHTFAALPLNHLGLKVEYHAIEDPLPEIKNREDVIGIVTWFSEENAVPDITSYRIWVLKNISKGRKFIILGNPGFISNQDNEPNDLNKIKSIFQAVGVRYLDEWINTYKAKVIYQDDNLVNFEKPYLKLPAFYATKAFNKNNSHLSITNSEENRFGYDLIVISPTGAYSAESYTIFYEYSSSLKRVFRKWYVNPFAFFEKAFSLSNYPIPDTTTQNGLRVFFAEVNGLGADAVTDKAIFPDYRTANEVLYENIFTKYKEMPFTIGYVANELNGEDKGSLRTLARLTLSLENVSPATSTYSYVKLWPKDNALNNSNYLTHEIVQSKTNLSKYSDKPIDVILWSGKANPSSTAIKLATENHLFNINGGNSVYDAEHDSIAWLSPLGLKIGEDYQVYSANGDETLYTAFWTKTFHAFKFIQQSYENTESPRRLKPISLNFNMYSGQKKASLTALNENIEYVISQPLFYTTTKNYIQNVLGFYSSQITKDGDCYIIKKRGTLNTFRFDNTDTFIDFEKSNGVIGMNTINNSIYVATDPSIEEPMICISDQANAKNDTPYVISSNWLIKNYKVDMNTITFEAQGWKDLDLKIYTPQNDKYTVIINNKETTEEPQNKLLTLTYPHSPFEAVKVKITKVRQ